MNLVCNNDDDNVIISVSEMRIKRLNCVGIKKCEWNSIHRDKCFCNVIKKCRSCKMLYYCILQEYFM